MNRIVFGLVLICMLSCVSSLSISVHVPEKYTEVIAGDRFYFEIEIQYPENPVRKDLRLEYEILTRDGELVSQSKALKAVEAQASFIDFIVIPESAEDGFHVLNVNVKDYEVLSEQVGTSFYVIDSGKGDFEIYLIFIFVAIILVGILVVLSILLKK